MGTNSNTTMAQLILAATLSTSVINLSYGINDNYIPKDEHNIIVRSNIAEWNSAFNNTPHYVLVSSEWEKYKAIIDFSHTLILNSKNLDTEYIDVVNENFWNLI